MYRGYDGWVNLQDYSISELVVFAAGCYTWVIAYAFIIYNIRKHRVVEMPTVAGCGNFAWEFLWSFLFIPNLGYICVWAYRAWFFLDIFIFWSVLRYADQSVFIPLVRRYFRPLVIVTLLSWVAMFYFFIDQQMDTPIGAHSAYILNLVISATYPFMILQAPSLKGISWPVAWLKMIGTGLTSTFMFMHYPGDHFLLVLTILVFLLDAAYVYVYWLRKTGRVHSSEALA